MNSRLGRLNWRRVWPWLLLPGLVLTFFHKLAFSNLILARGDTFLYFYPYWTAAADALRAARLPLWNPNLFMGAPLLANSQMGFFYPLNWPLWLLLPAPYAVSAAILLHITIAGWGTYVAARRLQLQVDAAVLAALLFSLGGYLLAQVEHVNQLQGLAWLPWQLAVVAGAGKWEKDGSRTRAALALSVLFALQLLAGHTQTVFISGVGLGIWLLAGATPARSPGTWPGYVWQRGWPLALAALLALGLAAVQLLPTFELTGLSSRQGGLALNEVLSFSFHPLLAGAALLPAFNESIFTEYVAFLPITVLMLAVWGGAGWRRTPAVRAALALVLIGLFLALGQFNPANWLLGRLPGFNLFRAPARWLALYALGVALLAGWGWQTLPLARARRSWIGGGLLVAALIAVRLLAPVLLPYVPVGAEATVEVVPTATGLLWLADGALFLLLVLSRRQPWARPRLLTLALLLGVGLILFISSRPLPFNQPTTPFAFFEFRPALARLLAETAPLTPPDRFISLSDIFFDLGDQAELDTIYADQLDERARQLYTVVNKQKAVGAPNLPLVYGLHTVDGFDGGILPLAAYTEMTRLLLPPGVSTTDGRLRELLPEIPEARWLDLFNARFVLTDKVGDVWREAAGQAVFFDMQLPVTVAPGAVAWVGYVPDYEATAIWLLAESAPGDVYIALGNRDSWTLKPAQIGPDLWEVRLPAPVRPQSILLRNLETDTAWTVAAMALVDARDGSFQSIVAGQYRLIYSGDVKIYENLDVLPRAFVAQQWVWAADRPAARAQLAAPEFDPHSQVVLQGIGPLPANELAAASQVTISYYDQTRVVVDSYNEAPGVLVLTDADYPGWSVTLDGNPAELLLVDGLFRGVFVPAGNHSATFTFRSAALSWGALISGLALVTLLAAAWRYGPLVWPKTIEMHKRRRPQAVDDVDAYFDS